MLFTLIVDCVCAGNLIYDQTRLVIVGCTSDFDEDIVFGENVKEIYSEGQNKYAFMNCKKIPSISFKKNSNLISIGKYSFSNTTIQKVDLENCENLAFLNDSVFESCSKLKTVSLPERISKIHNYCFYGTTSLLTIKIPDSVESIQSYAFYKSGLQTILITGNSKLKEISFDCFSYTKISSFYIPKSLTKLDISNLINCPLNEIRVHPNNMKYRGDVNNKFLASGNTLIRVVESCSEDYIVDDLITSIAQYCFYNTRISSVKLNDKIQYIGNNAFKNCYSLTNIIIPGSVIEIGFNAFFGCNHLKAIKFLSNSNKIIIGFSLFDGISNPINIYIPGKFDLNSSINKSFPIGSHLYITSHTTLSDSCKTFFW